jgi:mono/diheme cytochrome c family protein/plastocyanin
MTDQPGRPPEERLPAPRPQSAPEPASRFSAPPSAHRQDLTPERAARIVRQSANARLFGFLAVVVVSLFVIGYYFYELGLPGGLSTPRLDTAAAAQQVTAVQRGYNIFQANCAQCHGAEGQGGKGPILHDQVKLYQHLNPDYIRNMLQVGGRYACGNANSIMPVWSNTGNPPGPLNYMQINNLIAFLRAPSTETYQVLDPNLFEPVIDPATGQPKTFKGWVDPAWTPAPGATPYPACWQDSFKTPAPSGGASPAPSAGASGSPAASPGASGGANGVTITEVAQNIAFQTTELTAPAGVPITIHFENQDAGVPHNMVFKNSAGTTVFTGDLITGVNSTDYTLPGLQPGDYTFVCAVHANMTGTLKVGN